MTTTADLTAAYLAFNASLSGSSIVPTVAPDGPYGSVDFILAVPVLAPAVTSVVFHIAGTFKPSSSVALSSTPSSDAAGYADPSQFTLAFGSSDPVLTTQTVTLTTGPGVEQYDDAIAAGDFCVLVSLGRTSSITSVTYEVVSTAAAIIVIPPLRQYPRNDGLGASSAKRIYPPPKSIQASNRRAGGYL